MEIKRRMVTLGMMALGETTLGMGRALAADDLYEAAKKEGRVT